MRLLAHGQGLTTFFIVEAILGAAFLISLIATFFVVSDARARRRCLRWAGGFLAAAFIWPMVFEAWRMHW